MEKHWTELDDQIHNAVLGGLADHLHYLYGHIRADKWEAKEKPEAQGIANTILSLIKKRRISVKELSLQRWKPVP